jgi:pSer/pThr/pTyr-binding forkhead associated (FHA) protein
MSDPPPDSFSAACGLDGPLGLEVFAPGGPRRHTFASPWVVLGAGARVTLPLSDPALSQRHAYLQVLEGGLFALDLGSRAGIAVGGERRVAGWLGGDRRLSVGPFQVGSDAPLPAAADCPLNGERPSLASFEVFRGQQRLAGWRMNRQLVLVGASPRCRVRLGDPAVSRVHCSLVATPRGVWLVDLCSRTGTRRRGEPVEAVRLADGDTFEVGPYHFRMDERPLSAPATPLARPAPVVVVGSPPPGPLTPQTALASAAEQAVLGPLVQQFTAMQQHMFDQFQQVLLTLVQMMSSMHQQQAALIREELAQFSKATQELHDLQEQLRRGQASPPARNAGEAEARRPVANPWPAAPPPAPPAGGGSLPADENVQEWLNQRIAGLQTERQGRWNRLLGFLRVS